MATKSWTNFETWLLSRTVATWASCGIASSTWRWRWASGSSSPSRCPSPGSWRITSWRKELPPTLSASSIRLTSTTTLHFMHWQFSGVNLLHDDFTTGSLIFSPPGNNFSLTKWRQKWTSALISLSTNWVNRWTEHETSFQCQTSSNAACGDSHPIGTGQICFPCWFCKKNYPKIFSGVCVLQAPGRLHQSW